MQTLSYLPAFDLRRTPYMLSIIALSLGLACAIKLLMPNPTDSLANRAAPGPRAALSSTPIYSEPGAEAAEHAKAYLASIDAAMTTGLAVLRGGDSASITAQSRYLNALINDGYAQFGASYDAPLGSCGAAGSSARQLWHSQLRLVQNRGAGSSGSEVNEAQRALQKDRAACLAAAVVPREDWAPTVSLTPLEGRTARWPDEITGLPATNL